MSEHILFTSCRPSLRGNPRIELNSKMNKWLFYILTMIKENNSSLAPASVM